jgi:Sporulation and spore germination
VRRKAWLAVALVCLGGLSACGIPSDPQANPVESHNVPFHLLSPTIPTSTTTSAPEAVFVTEPIYLLNPFGLAVVRLRDVATPANLSATINALLAGPTSGEVAAGITTAIPLGVRVLSITQAMSTATINLNATFGLVSSSAETQAIGQLVLTATTQSGIGSVNFEINGTPIAVPTASGASSNAPVTAADYRALLGP